MAIGSMAVIFIMAVCFLSSWEAMWLGAISLFGSMKLLTIATCVEAADASTAKRLGYLLLWPGMNPNAFFEPVANVAKPRSGEWLFAISKLLIGIMLIYAAIVILPARLMLAGWIGFVGLVFFFHLGLFHISSLGWRLDGVGVRPIMDWPILATSLSDFWGNRWNRAFRDLMFYWVFRPITRLLGPTGAMLAAFLVSGWVHELIITVPARSGYGGPTAYFLLQAAGLLIERTRFGRKVGLGAGIGGRIFCLLFVLAPVGLLFPAAFIRQCIVPTLRIIARI
jgi:hypothetical protein